MADATGLTDDDSGRGTTGAAATVRRWLETDGDRCLLVFDDVSDPEVLRAFVPAHGAARVLVTCRRRSATNLGTAVPVGVFDAAEASAFLASRTGLDDEAGAAALAAVLGHLPLALALAAPVIRGKRHGYARYLDRLQTMPTEASLTGGDDLPYSLDVAQTVLLSLAAIRTADTTGMCARVMAIMSVLSTACVRRELLHVARRLGVVCWVAASVLEAHAIAVAGPEDRPAVRQIPQQVTALHETTAKLVEEADEDLAEILLRLRFILLYHLIELGR